MFQANYYNENNEYYVDVLLLGETKIGTINDKCLKNLVDKYISFEEQYFNFKFNEEIKNLKHENAKLAIEYQEKNAKQTMIEIIDINKELQKLYIKNGFDKLRREAEINYIMIEKNEIRENGGVYNG